MQKTQNTASNNSRVEILSVERVLAQTRKKSDFQRVQCILLRLKFRMSAEEVAGITGYKAGTVRKIWSQYRRNGIETLSCKDKGGRRNSHMTMDEEKLFLSPFFLKAEQGGKLSIPQLKSAFEKRIGQSVPKSTIYRLLKRHGWKKKKGSPVAETVLSTNNEGELNNYWIQGCTQAILPKKSGNISQQWLNSTLNSMLGKDSNDPGKNQ